MRFKPLSDRLLIEIIEEEDVKKGIIIPDSAKSKPQKGKVLKAGPGKKDEAMQVKEGDTVLFNKYGGTEVKIDEKNYLILRQDDILGIL
ncbi:MAG: co-chaperone GroES [Chlamydiae bacterium]|jgi:chaperonin GroES|nr:co-chaperone GroES [Chlamydiota bacterium]